MENNKFESKISTNEVRGYAISGTLLTADISGYSLTYMEPKYATVVLYQYAGHELLTAIQVSIDGLFNFLESGKNTYHHKTEWRCGDVDKWSFKKIGEFVQIVTKYHTGGQILISLRDAQYIAECAKETRDLMWEAGKEAREEHERKKALRDKTC
jgi:hypothetical protein